MKAARLFCLTVLFGMFSLISGALDWPQFRGPQRIGASQESGLLGEWPQAGPRLLWQMKDIDEGYGAPAVVGQHIYLISSRGLENEFVQELSVEGREADLGRALRESRAIPLRCRLTRRAGRRPPLTARCCMPSALTVTWPALERASGKIGMAKETSASDFGGQAGDLGLRGIPAHRRGCGGCDARRE